MSEFTDADMYREVAERMAALSLTASTPEMQAEFRRIAAMYEILARKAAARNEFSVPPVYAAIPE
jgi:hypothetical protein